MTYLSWIWKLSQGRFPWCWPRPRWGVMWRVIVRKSIRTGHHRARGPPSGKKIHVKLKTQALSFGRIQSVQRCFWMFWIKQCFAKPLFPFILIKCYGYDLQISLNITILECNFLGCCVKYKGLEQDTFSNWTVALLLIFVALEN